MIDYLNFCSYFVMQQSPETLQGYWREVFDSGKLSASTVSSLNSNFVVVSLKIKALNCCLFLISYKCCWFVLWNIESYVWLFVKAV